MPFSNNILNAMCVSKKINAIVKIAGNENKKNKFTVVSSPSIKANYKMKRVFLFCSRNASKFGFKAGITLEATILMLAFFSVVIPLMSLLILIDMESRLQMEAENTARNLAQKIYYGNGIINSKLFTENIWDISDNNQLTSGDIDVADDADTTSNQYVNVDAGTANNQTAENTDIRQTAFTAVAAAMMNSKLGIENINDSFITGGLLGLNYMDSTYDNETGDIYMRVKYSFKIPYISIFSALSDQRTVKTHTWSGRDIKSERELVYITKNGSVYHKSKACKYLNVGIQKVATKDLDNQRNKSGNKYKACNLCSSDKISTLTVYITDYGDRYHSDINCGGLTRSIITVDKSSVEDMRECSSCATDE